MKEISLWKWFKYYCCKILLIGLVFILSFDLIILSVGEISGLFS